MQTSFIDDRSINTEINKLKAKIVTYQDEQQQRRLLIVQAEKKIAELEAQKKLLEEQSRYFSLKVSDHAVVRYLERTGLVDINAIKKDMIDKLEEAVVYAYGNGTLPYGEGTVVVENFLVKTYLPAEEEINNKA